MFTAAWNLLALADKVERDLDVPVTRVAGLQILLDSYDTDAFVGHAVSFVVNLLWEARRCNATWQGRLYLRVHPKTPEMMATLGAKAGAETMTSLREECGHAAASLGRPDGNLMEALVDLVVMVKGMEADDNAPEFDEVVQRALMWPAVYSVTENDYLAAMKGPGVSFAALIAAAQSDRYCTAVATWGQRGFVKITRESEAPFVGATFELDVEAIVLLLVAAISHRARTWSVLAARYVNADLELLNLPYETVRAASTLAREGVAAPSELQLWCRASMSKKVFDQHASWTFMACPRPHSASEELTGSSYVCGADGSIELWYRMYGALRPTAAAKLTPDAMRESLRSQFGAMVDRDTTPAAWPLAPIFKTLSDAAKNGGGAPRPTVAQGLVVPDFAKTTYEEFEASFVAAVTTFATAENIVEKTLVHVADFNAKGSGRSPLAMTATMGRLATNSGAWPVLRWTQDVDESQKLEQLLKQLKVEATRAPCTTVILALLRHAFTCRDAAIEAEAEAVAAIEAEVAAALAAIEATAAAAAMGAAEEAQAMDLGDGEGDDHAPQRSDSEEDEPAADSEPGSERSQRLRAR